MIKGALRFVLISSLLLLLITFTVSANNDNKIGFSLSGEFGLYSSIPAKEHNDALPVRNHLTAGLNASSIIGITKDFEIDLGLSSYYTTYSFLYDLTRWRPFVLVGPTVELTYHFNKRFALSLNSSFMFQIYTQTLEFITFPRVALKGSLKFSKNFALIVPIAVDIRKEHVSVATTIGIKWRVGKYHE
jgi:hypothetical protein